MKFGVGVFAFCALTVLGAKVFDLHAKWTESMPQGRRPKGEPVLERGEWVAVCLDGEVAELA